MEIKKFMTPGIKDKVELVIQIYIWEILSQYQRDKARVGEELDYFQSFHLSLNDDERLIILHREEVPNDYQKEYVILDAKLSKAQAKKYLGFIFVIENEEDESQKSKIFVMMLGNEY